VFMGMKRGRRGAEGEKRQIPTTSFYIYELHRERIKTLVTGEHVR
jgi:hypothetical protein